MEALLDKSETAAYLNLKPRTLDYLVEKRRIPFVRVGRFIRFKREALDAWLDENTTEVVG